VAAQRLHQLDAGALHALHFRAAQVQVAVLQAGFLARVLVGVERQRRSLVLQVEGVVRARHAVNDKMRTGKVEVIATAITVLNKA
ncbi:hypothetical protein ACNF5F_26690, partial [Escherichia coli]|uniref:hypothetical protein n=1 Tax=Escherichia coli TaxID=562 RepID=UPI003BA20F74